MNVFRLAKDVVIGRARNLSDKNLFHHLSLVALLAWVGLGADGLSSSCYGPEAAFRALTGHTNLSLFVALASVITIVVICASYSQIIELFPTGGGGYLVASKLLSPTVGVVSGCALIGDYILTIAISVASGTDAAFSIFPPDWMKLFPTLSLVMVKTIFSVGIVMFLTVLNLRGAKESVMLWVPVFFVFVLTYTFAIVWSISAHFGDLPSIFHGVVVDVKSESDSSEVGWFGLMALVLRAYSLGAGTYTGIEAVSNGLNTLREPRVQTGKRTMIYMGASLSFVVGGLLLAYLLYHVEPDKVKTLNAVLFEQITANWPPLLSKIFVIAAMASSAALLFIAAQTGFFGGPRVLANMAVDRWMPTRFATLSDRLVTQNGVLLMGGAALLVVLFTLASVNLLVVLYSINVFITFSLSQLGMVRHWWLERAKEPKWKTKITVNGFGLLLTSGILISLCIAKFDEGGWATLLVTGGLIGAAFWVKNHYRQTQKKLYRLNELVAAAMADEAVTAVEKPPVPCNPNARTAVFLVNGFNGLGLHTLLAVVRMFPKVYDNFIFLQIGVLDAGNFKGAAEVENLREHAQHEVNRYVAYMGKRGFHTEAHFALGTDIVDEAAKLCDQIAGRFPQVQFFAGQLVFKDENFVTGWLHNHTVFELQRRLYQHGLAMLILPIQV
ncbi:MAG TPA: amino acid transporter [Verrucomicrobia subdivision 3 bacterium]|nr:amino acid transporter [Limisphaerales bacterium]